MTVALDLITDAALAAGVVGLEQPVSAADGAFILRRFQRMLDSWSNENLMIYDVYTDTLVLTPGTQSYSTSLLPSGRPVSIDSAFLTLSGISYPLEIIRQGEWNDIGFKASAGLPVQLFPDTSFPNTTLYLFPVPSAAYTLNLAARKQLAAGLTLASTVSLPPGYEQPIVDNLAVNIAPSYKRPIDPAMAQAAKDGKAWLKRTNFVPLVMDSNLPIRRGLYNIQRGY